VGIAAGTLRDVRPHRGKPALHATEVAGVFDRFEAWTDVGFAVVTLHTDERLVAAFFENSGNEVEQRGRIQRFGNAVFAFDRIAHAEDAQPGDAFSRGPERIR